MSSSKYIGQHSQDAVIEQFAEYVSPGKAETYRALGFAAILGRREGVRIWDLEGRCYINCRSSGGVFSLGHRPPRVIEAMRHALEEMDIGDHMLMSEQRSALAERLAGLTPGDIQYSFFTPSGGEAIDLAQLHQ
jgi:acetylornithine/succinyldiaminopimelate/putrescine aminotransferase